jgi:hypothetical protein
MARVGFVKLSGAFARGGFVRTVRRSLTSNS